MTDCDYSAIDDLNNEVCEIYGGACILGAYAECPKLCEYCNELIEPKDYKKHVKKVHHFE